MVYCDVGLSAVASTEGDITGAFRTFQRHGTVVTLALYSPAEQLKCPVGPDFPRRSPRAGEGMGLAYHPASG